jgi:pimeloyl-ACP methyl ester carboxylesterase
MASIPDPAEPEAEQPAQLPDAVNAAPPAHLLRVLEWRTGLEYLAALSAARRIADWPRGDGHPVLVLPGFLAGPGSTQLLRNVLRRLGYRVYDWGLGYNMGYRSSMTETLPARLHHIRERAHGRRVSLIGWSAGGIRNPARVARVREMSTRKIVLLQAVNGVRKTFPVKPIDCLSIARVIRAAT